MVHKIPNYANQLTTSRRKEAVRRVPHDREAGGFVKRRILLWKGSGYVSSRFPIVSQLSLTRTSKG
jgi:hypothetical protein